MGDNAGHEPEPITPELLADLQAGLLDDATAAALRQRVRTDSAAAGMLSALDRVRRDLADLGADQAVLRGAGALAAVALQMRQRPARRLRHGYRTLHRLDGRHRTRPRDHPISEDAL